jgi:hypothetical protein
MASNNLTFTKKNYLEMFFFLKKFEFLILVLKKIQKSFTIVCLYLHMLINI